jgi:hypothetical protein
LLGGGGVASFLAGVIVSVFFRRYDRIDAKYDMMDAKEQVSEQNPPAPDTVSKADVARATPS